MKKIIIFGATGTIGKRLIRQALAKGNNVTAFCRDKDKIKPQTGLDVYEGDVLISEDVQKAIAGQDVVMIALGSGKNRFSNIRSIGTQNIIEAMKDQGVGRLICQTTLGNGESKNNLNFFWKRIMFGWYLKHIYQDHERQEEFVKQSGLNWTIVRPSAFTNGELTNKYKHGFPTTERKLSLKISREDVASFMLKQIDSSKYLYQTPGISY